MITNCKTFMFILLFSMVIKAQTSQINTVPLSFEIPEIAILKIQPSIEPVIISLETITEAGNPITSKSENNNDKWLNYSSSIAEDGVTRNVSVEILSGTAPPGTEITLNTGSYVGSGSGQFGIPSEQITLKKSPQKILTGIGGAFTNVGPQNGHSLSYSIQIKNYDLLSFQENHVLFISYTISDD
ncbi:hypothetical protein [Tenacibaculum sp. C7A-26P2]|uniref:hypothetical protein n=1 Tax=Tenacibaculum sp. C7A-26P2 TaxID=3447504 RepID=UPI003F85B13F